MKASKVEQIYLQTENKVGKLEEVTNLIKAGGVNITAISAYAVGDKGFFKLITSDSAKTKEVLKNQGHIESKEVIILELFDEVGILNEVALKLKEADIDISNIYGTVPSAGGSANIIINSNNNDKILEIMS
ncbi:hypothetical protein ACFL4O_02450 [bacterium]